MEEQREAQSELAPEERENETQSEVPPEESNRKRDDDEADDDDEEEGGGDDDDEEEEEGELVVKAQSLMDKITSSPDNPSPKVLHALASLLETQESRYIEKNKDHYNNNARASHAIGRLGVLVRDNDEFFELVSSKYLSDSRYSKSVQAAAARVLLSCSVTWMYPHVFEDAVLEKVKGWVMDEHCPVLQELNSKLETGTKDVSDHEMLKTYATGLLALSLTGGGQLVEDVLTCGLSAKLMRYLRLRVLGDTNQRDSSHMTENKTSVHTSGRVREEARGRLRPIVEAIHVDNMRIRDISNLDSQSLDRDHDRNVTRQACVESDLTASGEPPDRLVEGDDVDDINADAEERWHGSDVMSRAGEFDENGRDESVKRRTNRGWARSRGKARVNEAIGESEHALTSPGSGSRLGPGRSPRDKCSSRNLDSRRPTDTRKLSNQICSETFISKKIDSIYYVEECKVGSKDITNIVKEAVRAAEAEARGANAPVEAIRAVAAAAAEVVKTAAFEEFKTSSDEDAVVLAASRAASTVIDAADAVEVSRKSLNAVADSKHQNGAEGDANEPDIEYFLPDRESLAQLREKYCIQCLETLGEYVEVLGPVLHEKGVDVCLSLLQRSSKAKEASKIAMLLPDIMKLICALAAHRKFAAVFVDRGGMQKLLAVPRVPRTFFGLSSCLFTIGSLQGIMERVCALSPDVVRQVVDLAIQLLECSEDQARKNAALFFAAAFVFRAVIDAFDAQDGLQKLLSVLNGASFVRSGTNSGVLALSASGSLRNDRSPAELLTSSEKQIVYHTCVALRQYFRAHLLLIVDSIRPIKSNRSAPRNIPSTRAAYKPLDISNEAMDAVFVQLQKDRKLGPSFVRARWVTVDKFLSYNGHITMLELCQAPPVERYLHDLLQYALGVLHIVTLVPHSRKMIVNATLSNNRVGIAVILDAANLAGSYLDPEIIQPALNVLINLVCPPPSISNKPPLLAQGQQAVLIQNNNGMETRERNPDRNVSDRVQGDFRERTGESSGVERGVTGVGCTQAGSSTPHTPGSAATSRLVGDRRISLGAGAGSAGLAAQLEQGYRQAREAVRANNGIKVLLHLLQQRIYSPPAAQDCLRALACRVLLGLARDDTIAHILTKLQVGKKLSELIRDSGGQTHGTEQGRWQAELEQAAIELIAIVTNSGRASTLAATDAATPTLRRIERAAIAAATPITYHSRELLLLIHEHLLGSGLVGSANALLKEAQLTPLPSLGVPPSLSHQNFSPESSSVQLQWPTGRIPGGFLSEKLRPAQCSEDVSTRCDSMVPPLKKKLLVFSHSFGSQSRNQPNSNDPNQPSSRKVLSGNQPTSSAVEISSENALKTNQESEPQCKTPIVLPMKRKHSDLKELGIPMSAKRLQMAEHGIRSPASQTPLTIRRGGTSSDTSGLSTPKPSLRDPRCAGSGFLLESIDDHQNASSQMCQVTSNEAGVSSEPQPNNTERLTLDSLVVQYLKHQHRQCPAPITTLPPLSLLHPHVCPEPKRSLDAPSNVTARLGTREFKTSYGGLHGNRKDRQFVYNRFRPWRTCRDDTSALLTCVAFLGDSSHIAVGSHSGELKIFDTNSNNLFESCLSHQLPLTLVQSHLSGDTQLLLSSSTQDVRLWDASSISNGPLHPFEGCKAARFSNSGSHFAALSSELNRREILLYDIQTYQTELKLSDTSPSSTGRGHVYSLIHFSPSDAMLLWNGVLWDRRVSGPVHRFDQFTDYGGGGFHPAGNEVIINSEVWDLRKFRLLRSVPSLDQTSITFNARGDVIYAILRRNIDDVMSAVPTRRVKHPLFAAFRTIDAVSYSDIATIPLERCVLDFATEPTDSFVGVVTMDDQDEMLSSARVYEIGRRRPTDDDSDPDDAESEDEDDEDDDDDGDMDPLLGPDLDDTDSDPDNLSNDDDSLSDLDDDEDEDGDFLMDDVDFDGGGGILEIVTDGEEDDDDESEMVGSFSSDEEDLVGNGFGF